MRRLIVLIALGCCAKVFAQPAVQIEDLEKFRARITVECSTWSNDEQRQWLAAIDSVRGLHGVVLSVSGIAPSAEKVLPYLLGAFLDAPISGNSLELRPTHNKPFVRPVLVVYRGDFEAEQLELLDLFRKRDDTRIMPDSEQEEGEDGRRLRELIRRRELRIQDRMNMMFEGN